MGKYIHICKMCGKEFSDNYNNTHFCSRCCYDTFRKQNSKLKNVVCPICGKIFHQKTKNQIFCSVECRAKSTEKRVECTCDYCGKRFERKISEVEKNKHHYCSKECKENAMFWNFDDTEILKENFSKMSYKEMINIFSEPKTIDEIKRRAVYLGLTSSREWSDEEIKILIDNYSTKPMEEVQKLLPNRTKSSILGQAKIQNIKSFFYLNNIYSEEENKYIVENYLEKSNEEIGEYLGRSPNGIAQHLYSLGLYRPIEIKGYDNLSTYIRKRLTPWKNKVKKDNNCTCCLTGEKNNIVVHHIRGFNLIFNEVVNILDFPIYTDMSEYTQKQLDDFFNMFLSVQAYYNDYVCITENIHKQFHGIYGYGNNTKEQWEEFVNKYYT